MKNLRDSMGLIKDLPHFTLYISLWMPLPVLWRGHQLLMAISFIDDFSFRPLRRDSAPSQPQPELSTLMGSKWHRVTKRQSLLYATASKVASPLPGTGRLLSSFHQRGHPLLMSSITIGVNGLFPEQDFHLQDIQPYGLRTKFTKKHKGVLILFLFRDMNTIGCFFLHSCLFSIFEG